MSLSKDLLNNWHFLARNRICKVFHILNNATENEFHPLFHLNCKKLQILSSRALGILGLECLPFSIFFFYMSISLVSMSMSDYDYTCACVSA